MTGSGPAGGAAATGCEPISWLWLERYGLGELPAGERQAVADHLAACDRCRACFEQIRGAPAVELRPLPSLPAAAPAATPQAPASWRRRLGLGLGLGVGGALAVASFLLMPSPPVEHTDGAGRRIRTKGGDVTWQLVRERNGSVAREATSFAAADRFQALLTCAPPLRLHVDLAVFQDGGVAFPGEATLVSCGNHIRLPPSFRITGAGAATVCLAVDPERPPPREPLAAPGAAPASGCVRLDHVED